MVSVSGYLIGSRESGKTPLPPQAELQWWYQYYFATERGRAGHEKYRHDFAKLIWQIASPKGDFDDATFDRSADSFDNPDHVSIVIHNYRWRLGLAEGEPKYDELEKRLAAGPVITVPTITLEGDANGAPHPDASSYAKKFSGKYAHRIIKGGVGHNGCFMERTESWRGTTRISHLRLMTKTVLSSIRSDSLVWVRFPSCVTACSMIALQTSFAGSSWCSRITCSIFSRSCSSLPS